MYLEKQNIPITEEQNMSIKDKLQLIANLLERFPNMSTYTFDLFKNYYITLSFGNHTFEERKSDHFNLMRIAKFLVDEFNKYCDYEFAEGETNFRIAVEWNYFGDSNTAHIYLRFDERDIDNIIKVLTKLTDPNDIAFKSFIKNDMFLY